MLCTQRSGDALTVTRSESNSFPQASTVKLVTTYLGLDVLGPSYVWTTELLADTGSAALYLVGSGAPLISAEQVEILAMETAAALDPLTSWHLYWDTSLFLEESQPLNNPSLPTVHHQ